MVLEVVVQVEGDGAKIRVWQAWFELAARFELVGDGAAAARPDPTRGWHVASLISDFGSKDHTV